jgi:hypothetical protein
LKGRQGGFKIVMHFHVLHDTSRVMGSHPENPCEVTVERIDHDQLFDPHVAGGAG